MKENELNLSELGVNLKQYRDNQQLSIATVVAELRDRRISNGKLVVDDRAEFVVQISSQGSDADLKRIQFVELARNPHKKPLWRSKDPGLNGIYFSILPSEGDFAGFQRITWADGRKSVVDISFNTDDGKGFLVVGYDLAKNNAEEADFDRAGVVEFGGNRIDLVSFDELNGKHFLPTRINMWQELGRIIFEPLTTEELRTKPLKGIGK